MNINVLSEKVKLSHCGTVKHEYHFLDLVQLLDQYFEETPSSDYLVV